LWEGPHYKFNPDHWVDQRFADMIGITTTRLYPLALTLGSNKKLVDEGVCVRADNLVPTILKVKSPIFLAHETKLLDKGIENLEDVGSTMDEEGAA
jgi:hypothetical protein